MHFLNNNPRVKDIPRVPLQAARCESSAHVSGSARLVNWRRAWRCIGRGGRGVFLSFLFFFLFLGFLLLFAFVYTSFVASILFPLPWATIIYYSTASISFFFIFFNLYQARSNGDSTAILVFSSQKEFDQACTSLPGAVFSGKSLQAVCPQSEGLLFVGNLGMYCLFGKDEISIEFFVFCSCDCHLFYHLICFIPISPVHFPWISSSANLPIFCRPVDILNFPVNVCAQTLALIQISLMVNKNFWNCASSKALLCDASSFVMQQQALAKAMGE